MLAGVAPDALFHSKAYMEIETAGITTKAQRTTSDKTI